MRTISTSLRYFVAVAFFLTAMLITTSEASAQFSGGDKNPEGRAKAITEKMKKELSLTEDQVPKVEAINLKYAKKNSETMVNKGSNRKLRSYMTMKQSQKERDGEMKEVLTEEQYKKYQEMVKEMEEKMKEKRTNG